MLKSWYLRFPKKIRRVALVLGLVCVAAIVGYFVWAAVGTYTPGEFADARTAASDYAHIIADSLKDTPQNLDTIQTLEREGKDDQALTLLVTEVQKNQTAQNAAVKLSGELETMAQNIPYIRPKKSADKALVAVSSETQLIYKLVSYNDYLAQLLKLLQDKITDKLYGVESINKVVDALNTEVDSINSLNAQFVDYMKNFDGNS